MDGTGVLFDDLVHALPPTPTPVVISYPIDVALDLDGLVAFVEPRLPRGEPYVMVGESFSGLVAVRLASRRPAGLVGLALVASFLRYPPIRAALWRVVARKELFRVPPPAAALRALLLGADAPAALVDRVRAAVQSVAPDVLARRFRAVLAIDARDYLARVDMPVMYIRGSRDRLVGLWAAQQVRAARSEAKVVTLEAPHLVLQRCPEEGATSLTAFVERCSAGGAAPADHRNARSTTTG
jgi:pimeloyl-ACP methyl ester carboxylesterase